LHLSSYSSDMTPQVAFHNGYYNGILRVLHGVGRIGFRGTSFHNIFNLTGSEIFELVPHPLPAPAPIPDPIPLVADLPAHARPTTSYIPSSVITYSATSEAAGGGGTRREFARNLGDNGRENWNKWYSGGDCEGATISMHFTTPQMVHSYSIGTANDCTERNPMAWELWGLAVPQEDAIVPHPMWHRLHQVFVGEGFTTDTSHWTKMDFFIAEGRDRESLLASELNNTLYSEVELRLGHSNSSSSGIQLGHLQLGVIDFSHLPRPW
jgi:hypothetical protein